MHIRPLDQFGKSQLRGGAAGRGPSGIYLSASRAAWASSAFAGVVNRRRRLRPLTPYARWALLAVPVGTMVTHRPPVRSVRAALPLVVGEPSFSDRRPKRARPKAFRICVSRSMLIGIGVARLEISDLVLQRIGAGCSPRRGDTEQGTVSSNKMIHHLDRFGLLGGGSHR